MFIQYYKSIDLAIIESVCYRNSLSCFGYTTEFRVRGTSIIVTGIAFRDITKTIEKTFSYRLQKDF